MATATAVRAALVAAALAIAGCGGGVLSPSPQPPPTTSPSSPVVEPAAPTLPLSPSQAPASPGPSMETASPSGSPSPAVDPPTSPATTDPVADLLPPPDGARVTSTEVERDEGVREATVAYRVPGTADDVRAHYRGVLRAGGWTLTGIDTDGAEWELEARRGRLEAEVEVRPADERTIVEVTVSEPIAP